MFIRTAVKHMFSVEKCWKGELWILTSSACCGSCMTNSRTIDGLNSTRYEKMSVAAAFTWTSSMPFKTTRRQPSRGRAPPALRSGSLTITISSAGKMPRLASVLKKASLFCGCSVCEKAQNSLKKFTCRRREDRRV